LFVLKSCVSKHQVLDKNNLFITILFNFLLTKVEMPNKAILFCNQCQKVCSNSFNPVFMYIISVPVTSATTTITVGWTTGNQKMVRG